MATASVAGKTSTEEKLARLAEIITSSVAQSRRERRAMLEANANVVEFPRMRAISGRGLGGDPFMQFMSNLERMCERRPLGLE